MSDNLPTESGLSLNTRSIRAAIRYLKTKKVLIIIAVAAGMAFGIFYSMVKRPLYAGMVNFSIEGEDNSGGGLLSLAAQFGLDVGGGVGGVFQGDNILELFKSRRMIQSTLMLPYDSSGKTFADEFLDVEGWRASGELPQNLYKAGSTAPFNRMQDSIMGAMYKYISEGLLYTEKPDMRLNIYNVEFKSHNEQFTKHFIESLVNGVSAFYIHTKTERANANVNLLQSRTDSIKRAYDLALYGRAAIQDANLNPAFQAPLVGIEKKQTDITVLGTAYGELLKNLELAKYSLLKEIPYIQIIDVPHYPLSKKSYPWYLYVPLAMIGTFILACGGLIGLRIIQKLYRLYFS